MKTQRQQQIKRQMRRESRKATAQQRFIELPTPRQARKTARAQANTVYKPVMRGLRSEVAGSKKREGELSDWYGGLASQIGQSQQKASEASQAQENALTQRLSEAGARDQSNLKELASRNEATAKLLGGSIPSSVSSDAAKGATAVAQQRVSLTSPVTTERASYQKYLGARQTSALERGIEAHKAETARRRKIKEDLRAGKKERGQAVVSNLEKLKEGARDYAIQKQAFGAKAREFGAERQENALDRRLKASEAASDRSIAQAKLGQTQAKLGLETRKTNQAARKLKREEREAGGKGGASHKAMSAARNLYEGGQTSGEERGKPWPTWGALATAVAKESEINPTEARRAVNRLKKKIEAANRRKAKAALGHSHR